MGLLNILLATGQLAFSGDTAIEAKLLDSLMMEPYNIASILDSSNSHLIQENPNPIVEEATKYLGTPYGWGGRDTKNNPNIDCLGLVFLAYANATNKDWKKFPVSAWELIEQETLGKPVKGLDGVLSKDIDYNLFKEGDVIHLLSDDKLRTHWKPVTTLNDTNYYAHHTGIYLGDRQFIHANPYSPLDHEVITSDLKTFVHEGGFNAISVTRPD